MFNSILRACMQTYLTTCISLLFSLKVTTIESKEGIVSLTLALLTLCYIIGCPIFSKIFLYRKKDKLPQPDFKLRYDSLYQNIDYYKTQALLSTSWFFVRRFLFAGLIVYCTSSIVLQIFLADVLCTCMLVFFITVRPMNSS